MEIIEVKNVITNTQILSLERLVSDESFPWYYSSITLGNGEKKDKGQLVHMLYEEGKVKDNYSKLILQFFGRLPEFQTHNFIRAKINLTTPYKNSKEYPHIDLETPNDRLKKSHHSISYLYYFHDSDGPTFFYPNWWKKIKVHPKRGKLVRFPSNLKHSGNNPTKYERRTVMSLVFSP